jgi:thymidylate synthase
MTLPHSKLQYTQSENASDIVFPAIDQIKYIVEKLKEVPHSRRAQGITWRPYTDTNREDCPCLQRIWARVVEGKLNFQTSWRSRDLFRAFEANAVGMMIIQEDIAKQLGVPMGTYADFSNSLHVYGQPKAVAEVRQMFETLWKRGGLEPEFVAKLNEMSKSDQFDV